jgi:hypothetical protein
MLSRCLASSARTGAVRGRCLSSLPGPYDELNFDVKDGLYCCVSVSPVADFCDCVKVLVPSSSTDRQVSCNASFTTTNILANDLLVIGAGTPERTEREDGKRASGGEPILRFICVATCKSCTGTSFRTFCAPSKRMYEH